MASVMQLLDKNLSSFLPNANQVDAIWTEFDKQQHIFGIVVLRKKTVIGYGGLSICMRIRGGTVAYIEDVVVDKKFRGKGLGSAIVENLVDIAVKNGCFKVSLECKTDHIGFYEGCGFSPAGCVMRRLI